MYIVFDIGATNMRLAASLDRKKFKNPVIVKSPKKFDDGIKLFNQIAKSLSGGKKVTAVAGGLAGLLDKQKTKLLMSHLKDWRGKPLKRKLSQILKAPVYLENDTAMVGLGEACHGAGQGYDIVVYVTISSGVGGARIVEGRIDRNSRGFEPGNHIINADGRQTTLENLISGISLKKRFGRASENITDQKVWADVTKYLAVGINNFTALWSPDVIVLGGGLMNNPNLKISNVKKQLDKVNVFFPSFPVIKKAQLGDVGGLYGALVFLRQQRKK